MYNIELDVEPDAEPDAELDVEPDIELDVELDVVPDAALDAEPWLNNCTEALVNWITVQRLQLVKKLNQVY